MKFGKSPFSLKRDPIGSFSGISNQDPFKKNEIAKEESSFNLMF
jgi:hypothetical protein